MERSGHGTKNSFLNMLNLKCLLIIHKELLSRESGQSVQLGKGRRAGELNLGVLGVQLICKVMAQEITWGEGALSALEGQCLGVLRGGRRLQS